MVSARSCQFFEFAAVAGCMLVTACGTIHNASQAEDPVSDAAPSPEVSDGAMPPRAFSTPVPIAELNSNATEAWPALTDDQLEIYFSSDRPGGEGGYDIWMSKRVSVDDMWQAPSPIATINTTAGETHLAVSSDGLQLYYTMVVSGSMTGADVYVSARASRASPWPAPTLVSELNSIGNENGVSISRDGRLFAFDSDRGGASGRDIYLATRPEPSAAWGIPLGMSETTFVETRIP